MFTVSLISEPKTGKISLPTKHPMRDPVHGRINESEGPRKGIVASPGHARRELPEQQPIVHRHLRNKLPPKILSSNDLYKHRYMGLMIDGRDYEIGKMLEILWLFSAKVGDETWRRRYTFDGTRIRAKFS